MTTDKNSIVLVRQHDRYATEESIGGMGMVCLRPIRKWFGRRGKRLLVKVRTRAFEGSRPLRFIHSNGGYMYAWPPGEQGPQFDLLHNLTANAKKWFLSRFRFTYGQRRTLHVKITLYKKGGEA